MKVKLRYDCERTGVGILYGIWELVFISILIGFLTKNILLIVGTVVFGVFISLIYFPTYLNVKRNLKNIENLKNTGKKTKGIITDYSASNYRRGSTSNGYEYYTNYTVTVSYFDEILGKQNTITTPKLAFNPQTDLGSKDCTVYYSDKEYYVTDFVKREKGQENIWGNNLETLEKNETKKVITYIVIFMIIWIAVVAIGLLSFFGII